MNLDNMTPGQKAEWLATMQYINGSAICSSLLYDLGLLPEQLENPMQAVSMLSVVSHLQKLQRDHAGQLEALTNTIFAIETAVNPLRSRVENARIINDDGESALILIGIIETNINKAKAILKPS